MNTVSGSSTYSTSGARSKGLSGLASGLDTEAMVESMLAGTQNKIDKQNASKQQLIWKQEIYRTIISQMNLFQSKYFDFAGNSGTNLMSNAFFNAMSAVSKSGAISATASSSAMVGKTSIQVGQLATKAKATSGAEVSGELRGDISGDAIALLTDKKVTLKVGDSTGTTQTLDIDLTSATTNEQIVDTVNQAATAAGVDLTAALDSKGKLTLTTKAGGIEVDKGSQVGLRMLGLSKGAKAVKGMQGFGKDTHAFVTTADSDAMAEIDVTLDGVLKKVRIDLSGVSNPAAMTVEDVRDALQKGIDKAHGAGQIKVQNTGSKLSITTPVQGRTVIMGGDADSLEALGMRNGESNKLAVGSTLGASNFSRGDLQGASFKFSINGVDFSFSENDTISDVMSKVNSSNAGVRLSYSNYEDKFTIESTSSGAGQEIEFEQTEGNLLSLMFGEKTGGSVTSGAIPGKDTFAPDAEIANLTKDMTFEKGAAFKVSVNGVSYGYTLPVKKDADGNEVSYTRDEAIDEINKQLADDFKDNDKNPTIQIDKTTGEFKVTNGSKVAFAKTEGNFVDADGNFDPALAKTLAKTDLTFALGFNREASSNTVGKTDTLADAGLLTGNATLTFVNERGVAENVTLTADTKLEDLETLTGGRLSFVDGKLKLASDDVMGVTGGDADGKDFMQTVFGTDTVRLNMPQGDAPVKTAGQNAKLTINGVATERSSNTFTANGLTINLKETTGKFVTDPLTGKEIFEGDTAEIDVSRNTEQIYEGIKAFVEDYNKLVDTLNGFVDAKAEYKDYAPLTAAQKKEMSESEIKAWEDKAKTGLIRNDTEVNKFLSSVRQLIYSKPEGSDYALFQLGVETSEDWNKKGRLTLTNGGADLKAAIESNPEAVQQVFMGDGKSTGLAFQMRDAIKAAAYESTGTPGTLVELAGSATSKDKDNTITDRITKINDQIKTLQAKYETEKARYWKQFNSMEQMISQMNSQSSWLSQQFA